MKLLLFFLSVTVLISCNYRLVKHDSDVVVQKEEPEPEPFSIEGTYTITNYVFADVSAMDDQKANEWVGKQLVFDELIHFNFDEIESYKDYFTGQNDCKCTNLKDPYTILAEKYFDFGNVSLKELKVEGQLLTIYESECSDYPLHKIALTPDHRLIFHWDGTYFILTEKK